MRIALISSVFSFGLFASIGLSANTQQGVITELLSQAYEECKSAHLMRRKDFEQAKITYANFKHIKTKIQELDAALLEGEDEEVIRVLGYCDTVGNDISRSEALPIFQMGVAACGRAATAVQENDLEGARKALSEYDVYREQAIEISEAVLDVYSVASELRRCERVAEEIEELYQQSQQIDAQIQPTLDYLTEVAGSCPIPDGQSEEANSVASVADAAPSEEANDLGASETEAVEAEEASTDSVQVESAPTDSAVEEPSYAEKIQAAKQTIASYTAQISTIEARVSQAPGLELLALPEFADSNILIEVQQVQQQITNCIESINALVNKENQRLEDLIAAQKQHEADLLAAQAAEEEAQRAAEELARQMESPEEKRKRLEKNIVNYKLVKRVAPEFPNRAIRRERSGYVVVEYVINTDGSVVDPVVVESEPKTLFNKAALTAVSQWQYQPDFEEGAEPDSAIARTRMSFALN